MAKNINNDWYIAWDSKGVAYRVGAERPRVLTMVENYIYLYHTDSFLVIPTFPEQVNDQSSVTFSSTNVMSRTAPIFSYSYSGPRTMSIQLNLHRELMYDVNYMTSNVKPAEGDDYVDYLVKYIQAAALPTYDSKEKIVDPPVIAIRFGRDIFCKGVVQGSVGVSYKLPIIDDNRYASVDISFNIAEIEPYDANTIMEIGSYREASISYEDSVYSNLNLYLDRYNELVAKAHAARIQNNLALAQNAIDTANAKIVEAVKSIKFNSLVSSFTYATAKQAAFDFRKNQTSNILFKTYTTNDKKDVSSNKTVAADNSDVIEVLSDSTMQADEKGRLITNKGSLLWDETKMKAYDKDGYRLYYGYVNGNGIRVWLDEFGVAQTIDNGQKVRIVPTEGAELDWFVNGKTAYIESETGPNGLYNDRYKWGAMDEWDEKNPDLAKEREELISNYQN